MTRPDTAIALPGGTFRMGNEDGHANPGDSSSSHLGFRCAADRASAADRL